MRKSKTFYYLLGMIFVGSIFIIPRQVSAAESEIGSGQYNNMLKSNRSYGYTWMCLECFAGRIWFRGLESFSECSKEAQTHLAKSGHKKGTKYDYYVPTSY